MQRTTTSPPADDSSGLSSQSEPEVGGAATRYTDGHLAFSWVTALVSAWFFLPAHSFGVAAPAICCGLVSVSLAYLAARKDKSTGLRVAAVVVGALPYAVVRACRRVGTNPDWDLITLDLSVSLVTFGIILLAIDGLRNRTASTHWMPALGFSAFILMTFFATISGLLSELSHELWLGVHLVAVPGFTVFFWFLATRIPQLRWLFVAILLGVALPVVAISHTDDFAFLGGVGMLFYIILQVAYVFASGRFLRRVSSAD